VKDSEASNCTVRKAKQPVQTKKILSPRIPKPGTMIKYDTVNLVSEFHYGDEITRCMSGKKILYFQKTMEKFHKQKQLFLCNLNDAYSLFKQQYPNVKVGFSKFCEIRIRNMVTAA
jgi:hypothetical protein